METNNIIEIKTNDMEKNEKSGKDWSNPYNKECPCCLEIPEKGRIILDCCHLLCIKCFINHLQRDTSCPVCRKKIITKKIYTRTICIKCVCDETIGAITYKKIQMLLQQLTLNVCDICKKIPYYLVEPRSRAGCTSPNTRHGDKYVFKMEEIAPTAEMHHHYVRPEMITHM